MLRDPGQDGFMPFLMGATRSSLEVCGFDCTFNENEPNRENEQDVLFYG